MLTIHVARNSVSSFLLTTAALVETLPAVANVGDQRVRVAALDALNVGFASRSMLLKLTSKSTS